MGTSGTILSVFQGCDVSVSRQTEKAPLKKASYEFDISLDDALQRMKMFPEKATSYREKALFQKEIDFNLNKLSSE